MMIDPIDVLGEFQGGKGLVTVIGRGHNGTRAVAEMLIKGGVFMGEPLNNTFDLTPHPNHLYQAARMAGQHIHIKYENDQVVDLTQTMTETPAPDAFKRLLGLALIEGGIYRQRLNYDWVGWKLPETLLFLPWLIQIFPKASYLFWSRDPRAAVGKSHGTDNLSEWGVQGWPVGLPRHRERFLSWAVQTWLCLGVEKPDLSSFGTLERWAGAPDEERARMSRELGGVPLGPLTPKQHRISAWMSEPQHAIGSDELRLALLKARQWDFYLP